jgi:hypothetical protein
VIQLITRMESLAGDADLGPAQPTLIRRHWPTDRYVSLIASSEPVVHVWDAAIQPPSALGWAGRF